MDCPDGAIEATARVHIESRAPVDLEVKDGPGRYRAICRSPCDEQYSTLATYRVRSESARPSSDFRLDGSCGQRVVLKVEKAESTLVPLGAVMLVAGGAAVVITPIYWFAGAVSLSEASGGERAAHDTKSALMLGIGAILLIGGIIMVNEDPSATVRDARPAGRPDGAHGATWHAASWRAPPPIVREKWEPKLPMMVTPISVRF